MRIDAHQHFWNYSPEQYPWIQPDWSIRRNFLPADLAPTIESAGIDGTIAVQARQSLEESRWLLQLSDESSIIKGVVGWVDLRSPEVEQQLEELSGHPRFVGVRHVVQDEPDDAFMLGTEFQRGISQLKPFGLTYDVLVHPRQLPAAIELVKAFPEQPFVLDHLAKPLIKDGLLDPWREHIVQLASHRNCLCKVSGMVTEANWNQWSAEDFGPYLDVVLEAFGVDRILFGSDWPVCLLAGTYDQVHGIVADCVRGLSAAEQSKIFGENAARFYCVS